MDTSQHETTDVSLILELARCLVDEGESAWLVLLHLCDPSRRIHNLLTVLTFPGALGKSKSKECPTLPPSKDVGDVSRSRSSNVQAHSGCV